VINFPLYILEILPDNLKRNLNDFTYDEEKKILDFNSRDAKLLTVDKKVIISNIIKDDKKLWDNILNFKKVDFNKIKELVLKNGIIVESKILKDYLHELGIIFSLYDK
jgi:uncharacterized protein YtpQ (UPF0354 family)